MNLRRLSASAGILLTTTLLAVLPSADAAAKPPFDVTIHGGNRSIDERIGQGMSATVSTTSTKYRITAVEGSASLGSRTVPFSFMVRESDSRVRMQWDWSNDLPIGTWRSSPLRVSWVKKSDPSVKGSFTDRSTTTFTIRQRSKFRDLRAEETGGKTVITGRLVYYSNARNAWVRAKRPAVVLQTRLSSSDPWKDLKRVRASESGWVRTSYRYRSGEGRHFQLSWYGWDTTWGASSLGRPFT